MRPAIKYIALLLLVLLVVLGGLASIIKLYPAYKLFFWLPAAITCTALAICIAFTLVFSFCKLINVCYDVWMRAPVSARQTSVIFVVLGLFSIEAYFRYLGMRPGFTCKVADQQKIIPVDNIVDYHLFIADSFGVTKFNPLADGSKFLRPYYVNRQGFHSHHDFTQKTIDSCKNRGLITLALIGDSYTYGGDADSGKSFADLLEQTGNYAVFNFGIPGTFPAQYEAVAKEYIKSKALNFDKVAVLFCGANDVEGLREERVFPGVPLMFNTNAGNIYGNTSERVATTARQAYYENVYRKYTVIGLLGNNLATRMLSKSVLISQLTGRIFEAASFLTKVPVMLFNKDFYKGVVSGLITHDNDIIANSADRIKKDCSQTNSQLHFFLIPGREMVEARHTPAFAGIHSIDAAKFTVGDYHNFGGSAHPLNSGHYKIFIEIERQLREH
jgi:hypothetical protein